MSEFGIRTPETLLEVVRTTENEKEEAWREDFLAKNLFHDKHLEESVNFDYMDKLRLFQLEQDFLCEKRGKNMGELFALALSDKYLGKIHVVELGKTTNPAADGSIDGLKHDYNELLAWMKMNGLVEKELSREESGRAISEREPVSADARGRLVVLVRNRPLIQTTIEHEGKQLGIGIAKRMVFSMPTGTRTALLARFGANEIRGDEVLSFIESTFLQHGLGGIQPIRTAYYLATDIK